MSVTYRLKICLALRVWSINPRCRHFLTPLQETDFWNIVTKRRNDSKQAISPFATMFSLIIVAYPFNYRDFLFFDNVCSKCCQIVVWGKGFINKIGFKGANIECLRLVKLFISGCLFFTCDIFCTWMLLYIFKLMSYKFAYVWITPKDCLLYAKSLT